MKNKKHLLPRINDYGYIANIISFLEVSEQASRQSGRTKRVLDKLAPDDVYIVHTEPFRNWCIRYLMDKKKLSRAAVLKKYNIAFVDPRSFRHDRVFTLGDKNVLYDHKWLHEHILWRVPKLLEFPQELSNIMRPKGVEAKVCQTYSSSARMWPEDTETEH